MILFFKLNNTDLNDLIHNQFREKMQAEHINYVAESLFFANCCNYVAFFSNLLFG